MKTRKNIKPVLPINNISQSEQELLLLIAKQILEEYKFAFEVLGQWLI